MIRTRRTLGHGYMTVADIAMPASYPAGGLPVAPAELGLSVIDLVQAAPAGGYAFEYDHAANKLRALQLFRSYTANHDLPSLTANTTTDQVVTVTGVAAADQLIEVVLPPTLNHGVLLQSARITGANQVTLRVANVTASAINPPALDFVFIVQKAALQEVPAGTNLSGVTARVVAFGR